MKRMISVLMVFALLMLGVVYAQEVAAESAQTDSVEETMQTETQTEEETAEEPSWLASTSSKITLGVLLIVMIVLLVLSAKRVRWNAAMIAKAAICVALAYLLSLLKFLRMPMGGSVCPAAMLPLIMFGVAFGPLEGVLIGCVFGLLQLLIDPYVIHPLQLLVDYPMAYGALALGCLATHLPIKDKLKLPCAVVLGYLGRYFMAVLSGVVFFADYAGEQGALLYSLLYNISYIGPEMIIGIIITLIPGFANLPKLMRANSART